MQADTASYYLVERGDTTGAMRVMQRLLSTGVRPKAHKDSSRLARIYARSAYVRHERGEPFGDYQAAYPYLPALPESLHAAVLVWSGTAAAADGDTTQAILFWSEARHRSTQGGFSALVACVDSLLRDVSPRPLSAAQGEPEGAWWAVAAVVVVGLCESIILLLWYAIRRFRLSARDRPPGDADPLFPHVLP